MDSLVEPAHPQKAKEDTLVGGGEMGALMRSLDWSQTTLGPVESWPQSLRTSVSICLSSRFPIIIFWGPDLIQIYNDAYRPILGASKHPKSMGQAASDCWPEIWHVIGPMLKGVLSTGQATWSDNQLLFLDRNSYIEECYFTFSYSPIRDETGGIGGVFCAVTETTGQVLGERRLRTLGELAARTADASTSEEACWVAAETLANNGADIPFALLYLPDSDGQQLHLAGATGLAPDTLVSPPIVDLIQPTEAPDWWPLGHVWRTGEAEVVDACSARGQLPELPSLHSPYALVLPMVGSGQDVPYGILVVGISPYHALDADYRGFFELVAGQIATAVVNALAYQHERERSQALAELDRAKTTFFSNVSHEFRTPLTLLLGPIEDILADTEAPLLPRQREQLEIVRRSSLRLLKLVNTLLDFARIEAGRMQAFYEPTDLAAFTAELASVFRSAIEQAGLRLIVDCPPLCDAVYVDRGMWEKIVLNLLSNAFKFTFEGQITVTLHQVDTHIELEVRDSGIGIAAEELSNIFKRFHRIRNARARTYEGSGIGLTLVQELIGLHGGTIDVTSLVGVGTSFSITLPLSLTHLPSAAIGSVSTLEPIVSGAAPFVEEALHWLPDPPAVAHDVADQWMPLDDIGPVQGSSPLKSTVPPAYILLVDDNTDMRDYVRRLLSQYWTVKAVADGAVALTTARERIPDLVLSDVMMPGLNGFELLHELRADPRTCAVPFILLSARAGEESTIEGLEAGADDYLVKPFSARELLARVGSHLEISRMRKDVARREHEHASRLQKLTEASLAINTMRTLEEVFWLITAKAREIIGAHQSLTCMAVHENWAQPINAASFSEKYAAWREYEVKLDGTAIYSLVCSTNTSLRMTQPELEAHPLWPEFNKQTETYSPESSEASLLPTTLPPLIQGGLLAAPLIGRDQRNLGLLLLSDKYEGEFTEEDEAILVQLAQIASIAIENAQLYSNAQNAVHARDALLSTVSHDLKNPLAAIIGYTQLLQRGINSGDGERLLIGLARIESTTMKMTSLINELLDLSHLQLGQPLELDVHPIDLVALVRQLVAEQQQTTQYHHIHVEASVTQLMGLFDPTRLGRMLANLLVNAIKYDLEGKHITVEVRQEEEADRSYAVLVVRDQGVGIPAKDLPHIFEQFYRADNVAKHVSGTGIGLASALQVVEQHDGTITATSKEGEGSTFTVRLPLHTE